MAKKSNPVLEIFSVFNEDKGRNELKMVYAVGTKTKTTTLLRSFKSSVDGAKHVLTDAQLVSEQAVMAHATLLAEHYINLANTAVKWTDEQKAEAKAKAKATYDALSDEEKARRKELAQANANKQFGIGEVPAWIQVK